MGASARKNKGALPHALTLSLPTRRTEQRQIPAHGRDDEWSVAFHPFPR